MLKIIGAGFSRTGTSSLKRALEQLGFGPCYHMHEVFQHPEHATAWANASVERPNWQQLFRHYTSAVDSPACHFWKQIHAAFPGSKLILTERNPEAWYESFSSTVFRVLNDPSLLSSSGRETIDMARKLELEQVFKNQFENKAHAIAIYEQHNQLVKDSLPADKRLVFRVSDGWEPLCRFLDVDIPESDFPHSNARDQFEARVGINSN